MFTDSGRRRFLKTTAATGTLLGLGDMSFLRFLPEVSAAEAKWDPNIVRCSADIEPLVRLLETTPEGELLEAVAQKVRTGTSYREVLAALLLAGVRNVQPRPSVGFKFHAVLVVNSAHLASLASPSSDRWLPIFWALDYYKRKQIEEERTSGWKMGPVEEAAVPPPHQAQAMFLEAMQKWDEPAADAAVAGLARTAGVNDVFEMFYRLGARDFRSIGHKAIFVANSQRTLASIGWRHAEPVLRSLAYALLNHGSEPNPADSDLDADRPWRQNQERAQRIIDTWQSGKLDSEATAELLDTLHQGTNEQACDHAVELLNRGVSPQSIWDAVLVGAGELLMRQPGIIGLHGLTASNALHFCYQASGDDMTRRLMLLQNCAFLPMFREAATRRGDVRDLTVDDLKAISLSDASPTGGLEEIFADVSKDRMTAAGKVRAYLEGDHQATSLIDAARRLVFQKGNDAHDYKFSSAVLEDYFHVSPAVRDQFLALSIFNLPGSGDRDNQLVQRTRAALG